jgi:hypothetical protein
MRQKYFGGGRWFVAGYLASFDRFGITPERAVRRPL